MCRAVAAGGRRCCGELEADERNARRRARYAAAVACGGDDETRPGPPDPPPVPDLPWEQARERIDVLALQVDAVGDPDSWGDYDQQGFAPTPAGLAAEEKLREAGGLIVLEAERRAAPQLQVLELEEQVALGGRTRAEVVDQLEAQGMAVARDLDDSLGRVTEFLSRPEQDRDPVEAARLLDEVRDRQEELMTIGTEVRDLAGGLDPYAQQRNAVVAEQVRQLLAEVRPMGPRPGQQLMWPVGNEAARFAAVRAAECFPSDWWQQSHACPLPLVVDAVDDRGGYLPVVGLATKDGDPEMVSYLQITPSEWTWDRPAGYANAVHELSHRMEHVTEGRLVAAEQVFLWRRTTDPDTGKRQPLERYLQQEDEYVRPDGFTDSYVGKDYGDRSTGCEVLSTGLEGTMAGTFGGLRGEGLAWSPDEDHRRFSIGCLALL